MEDVPAETPQSRLDQQSERDYEFEDEVRPRSRGVASSRLDEVSDAETLIMGPGGEVTGSTNRAEEVAPETHSPEKRKSMHHSHRESGLPAKTKCLMTNDAYAAVVSGGPSLTAPTSASVNM